jgi:hypothetical protein
MKSQVPHKHRDAYFPQDITSFLRDSTTAQLQRYIKTYKPAILQSIKIARKNASSQPKLHQYPGFRPTTTPTNLITSRPTTELRTHPHQQPSTPRPITLIQTTLYPQRPPHTTNTNTVNPYRRPPPKPNSNPRCLTLISPTTHELSTPRHPPTRRENIPRKHSKWKPLQFIQERFKAFSPSALISQGILSAN